MADSNNPAIVVIDRQKIRQAGLVRLLRNWDDFSTFEIIAISSCSEFKLRPNLFMVVISVGGVSVLERPARIWLQSVRSFVPHTPVVVLSDREDRSEICAAFAEGARGFIPTSLDPTIALDALVFIHRGGSFFPSSALIEEGRRAREVGSGSTAAEHDEVAGSEHVAGVEPPHERTHARRYTISFRSVAWSRSQHQRRRPPANTEIEGELNHPGMDHCPDTNAAGRDVGRRLHLTARQREVLKGLGEGKPNKVIARDLDMTESTVKVHVRQIMRKLGAENRTQVALFAVQFQQADMETA